MHQPPIFLKNVRVHNLKGVDLELPSGELVVFTGISGSGKSSLAFDTLFVEGQRRYVESLSTYSRRQMGDLAKPDLEFASGITPTLSIEQKSVGRSPRSTVGTLTEIYDYLRVLYARIAIPHCPVSGMPVASQSKERIIRTVQTLPEGNTWIFLSPQAKGKKGEFKEEFEAWLRRGFTRVQVDGEMVRLDEKMALDKNVSHHVDLVIDRIRSSPEEANRIAEAVTTALQESGGQLLLQNIETKEELFFSLHSYSPESGLSYDALEPHHFSFNSTHGMCDSCLGLGRVQEFDLEKIIDPKKSIAEDCCEVASSCATVKYGNIYRNLAEIGGFDLETPWYKLPTAAQKLFLYGTEKKWTRMHFIHPLTGAEWTDHVRWRGVLYEAKSRFFEAKSDGYRSKMGKLMKEGLCPDCQGERLKPFPRAALLGGRRIGELARFTLDELTHFFSRLKLSPLEHKIGEELIKEILARVSFLKEVGLEYLTLDRTSPSLSGGEAQRVRLASQIGSGLVGVTYILDEPSIGLHPSDNLKLIRTLEALRDKGNTVVVVEHDEETILAADRVVDFGPGAGVLGGRILVNGSVEDLLASPDSITGSYLAGKNTIPLPKKRRKKGKGQLLIKGASHHNLKNVDAAIPLGLFVAITGVSGSGKSSLISDILFPALSNRLQRSELQVGSHLSLEGVQNIDKVIQIDQTPIGRNPRSNPATYIKLFDEIRELFATLPESRARGYLPGRFSFNVKEGSCPECKGMGMLKIDMDFMEEEWVECPLCQNRRFDPETLSVHFKGKTIYDVLEMDVEAASIHFDSIPSIRHKLEVLKKVGLHYLKLGQSSTHLSGGEAQRIKLAKELVRPSGGKALYILDEPTTGLHLHDIKALLQVLHELVERGNTVLVIEHHMEVVKTADWVIDLGPGGGERGGKIIAEGPPEKIAACDSPTGKALHATLQLFSGVSCKTHLRPRSSSKQATEYLRVENVEQNNLKRVSASIPRGKITVCTGPSGSGKSSFAFETIYAEGQRRYTDSLSPYARQFVKQMPKPKCSLIEGLSPAIAIEQKAHAGNPRSTVGTMTEIYDYLRLLYARLGTPHCPETGEPIKAISKQYVIERLLDMKEGTKLQILAPIEIKKHETFPQLVERLKREGYVRIRLNHVYYDLDDPVETFPFDKKKKNELCLVIDRIKIDSSQQIRLAEAIEQASNVGKQKLLVALEEKDLFYNLAFSVESTGKSYPEITPQSFAFNKTEGMCPDCMGLGITYGAHLEASPLFRSMTVDLLLHRLISHGRVLEKLLAWLESQGVELYLPLSEQSAKATQLLLKGSKTPFTWGSLQLTWKGINQTLAELGQWGKGEWKEALLPLLNEQVCGACQGERLHPLARAVTLNGLSIGAMTRLPIYDALKWVAELPSSGEAKVIEEVKQQVINRLNFLARIGLGYLALERKAPSLSGGEAQRIRLARQLGSGLTGVLYVLDEPTVGLHPYDNVKLNQALKHLKELGNTLLLVEHDPLTMQIADHVLEFGPGAGAKGGQLIAEGAYPAVFDSPHSLTGQYLRGNREIPFPEKIRKSSGDFLAVRHACQHNLQNISCKIPIGLFTCITGVSGSGKSTLLHDVIAPAVTQGLLTKDKIVLEKTEVSGISHFDRVISVDQNPVGSTIRSDVMTYVEALDQIRSFYAKLPTAIARGLQPKNFSYNHLKGMCTSCWGLGFKKIEMHFLPSVKVVCDDCKGLRLNPLSLSVTYQGKSVGDLLDLTVEEAASFFGNHPKIVKILNTLISVGLGYLKLGQATASLSGGEAQRMKLSRELAKRSRGKTLYLIDEPTTGLHASDVEKLLPVLHRLVNEGNTLIVVEHHTDLIKNADYVIDLGPGAGSEGGKIVASGTPADIAKNPHSKTGAFLNP